jgi:DNA-binding CsgD family transcriptional regulator
MMLTNKHIIILSTHPLEGRGLKSFLYDEYHPEKIVVHSSPQSIGETENSQCDLFFVSSDLFVLFYDYFLLRKNKVIIFGATLWNAPQTVMLPFVNTSANEESLKAQIDELLPNTFHHDNNDGLTSREIEVLTLVAQGLINKEIADSLNISLHTVISHRKNIAAKLGIKTVAGFTMYAAMNGLITLNN